MSPIQSVSFSEGDGNYYGATLGNTAFGQLTPTGVSTTLQVFGWSDGAQPLAAPVHGADGNFYGTAATGATTGEGVIYRITPAGEYSVVYSFHRWRRWW